MKGVSASAGETARSLARQAKAAGKQHGGEDARHHGGEAQPVGTPVRDDGGGQGVHHGDERGRRGRLPQLPHVRISERKGEGEHGHGRQELHSVPPAARISS